MYYIQKKEPASLQARSGLVSNILLIKTYITNLSPSFIISHCKYTHNNRNNQIF